MFGIGKNYLKKALGISNAQRQLSRKIGIPLSKVFKAIKAPKTRRKK
jgi:hypothetical protein